MKFWLADERIMVNDPAGDGVTVFRAGVGTPQRPRKVEVEVFDENGHPIGKFKADRDDFQRLAAAL